MEEPAWVQLLFNRGHGLDAFRNRFVLDIHRLIVEECIAPESGRQEVLRRAAAAALETADPARVVQGLSFLLVVGTESDGAIVEPLTQSTNDAVQKAAKTCLFELMRSAEKR